MSTWLNGLGPDRPKPKSPMSVSREEVSRAIVKSATLDRELKQLTFAQRIGTSFLHLLQDFGFHSGRSHKRYRPKVQERAPETIVAEVRRFYKQRPRPWCSPNARARLLRLANHRSGLQGRV